MFLNKKDIDSLILSPYIRFFTISTQVQNSRQHPQLTINTLLKQNLMNTTKLILIGLILSITLSCQKETPEANNSNYLIFGQYYGMCFGETCVETFKLTNGAVYEDQNDEYPCQNLRFTLLNYDKFDKVRDLSIPEELLNDPTEVFGCPDCADGGGLFIQYSDNGVTKSWRIDQDKNRVPTYLHDFIDDVNEKISMLE